MTHTPGPWHVGSAGYWPAEVFSEDQNSICYLDNTENTDMRANATLIAAAPKLLATLIMMVVLLDTDCGDEDCQTCSIMKTAKELIVEVNGENE